MVFSLAIDVFEMIVLLCVLFREMIVLLCAWFRADLLYFTQRSVKHIDPDIQLGGAVTSKLQILRHGHKGVLTTDFDAKAEDKTTVRVTYTPPQPDTTRLKG